MKQKINTLKYKGIICTIFLLALTFYSCDDFVDVDLPPHLITGETVFEDINTAEAALGDIYSRLRDEVLLTGTSQGLSVLLGVYTDELEYFGSSPQEAFFFNNNLIPSNTTISTFWKTSYNLIYGVNAVLEGVENATQLQEHDKQRLKGEALFLRAFIHSYLTGIFGDIPYVRLTDYEINSTIAKVNVAEVFQNCINDALEAKALLTNEDSTGERLKPNKTSAQALLARLYLYSGQWTLATNEASEVINTMGWETDVEQVFLKESPSTIWQLYPFSAGLNTLEAQSFIFVSGPPPARSLSTHLEEAFEQGDLRRLHWIGTVTDGTNEWYYPYKYKLNTPTPASIEYSKVFRLAEMYLINAEAKTQLGLITEGKENLNIVRFRAGLPETEAQTQSELLDAIFRERQVEFFTEFGHRFFDLKRSGNINQVLGAVKPGWESKNSLWPLPEQELIINPNLLPQNQGY